MTHINGAARVEAQGRHLAVKVHPTLTCGYAQRTGRGWCVRAGMICPYFVSIYGAVLTCNAPDAFRNAIVEGEENEL